jgi:monofunctional glycosyltransferase
MKIVKWVGGLIAALLLLGMMFLAYRVVDARGNVESKVATIIAQMDPVIDTVPRRRLDMLLTVEDPTFNSNDGIDLQTPGAGMTTLSQGLGKRLFFQEFKPGINKLELMLLTKFALVPKVPREDILRATLASAYLGHVNNRAVIGFAEASKTYFSIPLNQLSDRQWLSLVAMLPAPNKLSLKRDPKANAERVERIENLLAGRCEPENLRDVMLNGCAK